MVFYENENHIVAVSPDGAFIYTQPGQKHLKGFKAAVKFINNHLIVMDESKFYGMSFEAKTLDYLRKIDDVERYAKDLRVDRKIIQKYNRQRDKKDVRLKYYDFEHYCAKFESMYSTENGYCSRKEVMFTNAEYYDETIGTLSTTIEIRAVYGELPEFSILSIYSNIEELQNRQFNLYKDCFNDEYLETLK